MHWLLILAGRTVRGPDVGGPSVVHLYLPCVFEHVSRTDEARSGRAAGRLPSGGLGHEGSAAGPAYSCTGRPETVL